MIFIVDSGSTKSDWQLVKEDGTRENYHTIGFNPFFFTSEQITDELNRTLVPKISVNSITHIYFYGAGCSDAFRSNIIKEGLLKSFPYAHIEVDHDLLASARATCGNEPGIACIIGTGSNSCAYDGLKVIDNVTNLGYLLGDEGSGSHLGKMLIQAYFYRELPEDLIQFFEEKYPYGKREILNKIYGPNPNVYLASFATFVSEHRDNLFIQKMVMRAFDEFIKRHIMKYKNCMNLKVHFVGSIAYHFSEILKMAMAEHNLKIGVIVQKPINNLVNYHLNHSDTTVE